MRFGIFPCEGEKYAEIYDPTDDTVGYYDFSDCDYSFPPNASAPDRLLFYRG